MSLELAISKLTDAVIEQNAKLDIMLAKAGAAKPATAAAEEGEDKPKRTRASAKKDEGKETGASDEGTDADNEPKLTNEDVKKLAGAWLAEFKADETDPETDARRTAIKAALAKLMKKEGATVLDVPAADLPRVVTWIENQKKKDNGFGVGRLTEKPGAAEAEGAEDEI